MDERDPVTDKILCCAVALHRAVGPALKESVYHRGKILGEFFPDFVVNDQVIVEVKSASAFDPVFEFQMINYLRVTKLERALLLNFGRAMMRDGIHRFVSNWND